MARIADELGVERAHAALTPAAKVALLSEEPAVIMVGDGANDAPAGADALASVAVDGAATLQRGTADVALLEQDLRLIPWLIMLAKRARRLTWTCARHRQHLQHGARDDRSARLLRPIWAGLSMIAASLLALGLALQITRERIGDPP